MYIKLETGNSRLGVKHETSVDVYTVKPAHAVTFILLDHRKFHMNLTSSKRSPFL
jgi:hypothetical protein